MNERILEERKRLGFNQTEFAKFGGVQISAQGNYEKGLRVPDANYLAGISEAGADIFYILQGNRSDSFLTTEERFLLEKFRTSPSSTQNSIWALLLSDTANILEQVALACAQQPKSKKQSISIKKNKGGQIANKIINN